MPRALIDIPPIWAVPGAIVRRVDDGGSGWEQVTGKIVECHLHMYKISCRGLSRLSKKWDSFTVNVPADILRACWDVSFKAKEEKAPLQKVSRFQRISQTLQKGGWRA